MTKIRDRLRTTKQNITLKKDNLGRSMLEMLAVLALIGILSITALMGYRFAMDKNKANLTQQELSIWAITCSQQLINMLVLNTSELGTVTRLGYDISASVSPDNINTFDIYLQNVPSGVCKRLLDLGWNTPSKIYVGEILYEGNNAICGAADKTPEMIFVVSNDSSQNGENNSDKENCSPNQSECGMQCCNTNATCLNESCCLNTLMCNGVCCPSDKPVCKENSCINPENSPCTTNADCASKGQGYFCQIGAKASCGSGTVIGKCKKASANIIYGNGVRFAKSPFNGTRFDLENYCEALGMSPMTGEQANCQANPSCYASGLYTQMESVGAWDGFWVIMPGETACEGDVIIISGHAPRSVVLSANYVTKNREGALVCAKGTPTGSCDIGFTYDTTLKECICQDDNACFTQSPDKPHCLNKKCVACLADTDCSSTPLTPYCGNKNTCVSCRTTPDCAKTPATPICSPEGKCVKCGSDEDCTKTPSTPYCNAVGACVKCYNNEQCATGQYCLVKTTGDACIADSGSGTCKTLSYKAYTDSKGGTWYKNESISDASWNDTQNYCEALNKQLGGRIRMMTRADLGCNGIIPQNGCYGSPVREFGWRQNYYLEAYSNCAVYEWELAWNENAVIRPTLKNGTMDNGTNSWASCYKP